MTKICDYCNDGGICAYPQYGMAPYDHGTFKGGSISITLPKEKWPNSFEEDEPGCGQGYYHHCPKCGGRWDDEEVEECFACLVELKCP